ncbi:hypothetical protein OIE53_13790 [Micromonospora sp. NBC_01739]|nr:hypothetical protein OIE53_13790 [Micromonospora sp. NBC_01739]
MKRSEQLSEQLDWYWRKNLRPRLEGLTDEECPAPGLMETSKSGRNISDARTEEVQR